ncbi:MAG: hypothetical protein RL235_658 [Chlamydiota bacterium]|jgi:polar amino acid transport system substrate-binding protein
MLLIQVACSSSVGGKKVIRIGVDATWYPIDFGPQQPYVNGYIDDLLLEVATQGKIAFEKVHAEGPGLQRGLVEGQFDAIITSIPRYEFLKAQYDFSDNALNLGPVLVTRTESEVKKLDRLQGHMVGVLEGDDAVALLRTYPSVIIRHYGSVPELLNAVVQQETSGALLSLVPAASYVTDLYQGVLHIASRPLTGEGLHIVVSKKGNTAIVPFFNRALKVLKKKKTVDHLLTKWQLNLSE